MTDETRLPEQCIAFLAELNSAMDSATGDWANVAHDHLIHCAECRARVRAAGILQFALQTRPIVTPPRGLTEHLVSCVIRDQTEVANRRRRLIRWSATISTVTALVILIAILASQMLTAPNTDNVSEMAERPKTSAISIDQSVADAGTAIASITRRSSDSPKRLLPMEPIAPRIDVSESMPDALEPTQQSLQHIRDGAASGLAPIADSARRAFAMFVPTGAGRIPRKPDR